MIKVGDVFTTKNSGNCVVIEYINAHKVGILWLDGTDHKSFTHASTLRSGQVKSKYTKSVYGVGYIGEGEFTATLKGRLTAEYKYWHSMMTRCYSANTHEIRATYKDKEVCEEWHNFQVFALWCQTAVGFGSKDYVLDKDGIFQNNKIYSPAGCCFVPQEINAFFVNTEQLAGKELPVGVSFDKSKNKFIASCSSFGEHTKLGEFSTVKEAYSAYKKHKTYLAQMLADKYKFKVSQAIVDSLLNYGMRLSVE